MAALNNDGRAFIVIVIIFILNAQAALSLGTLFSILAPNTETAFGITGPAAGPLLILSGVYLNNSYDI